MRALKKYTQEFLENFEHKGKIKDSNVSNGLPKVDSIHISDDCPSIFITSTRYNFVTFDEVARFFKADQFSLFGIEFFENIIEVYFPTDRVIFIDVDEFSDVENVVDSLASLRMQRPDLIIILVSHMFSRTDLDKDRISICDASIRLPISLPHLEFSITEASYNNMIWQERLRVRIHNQ